MKTIGKWGGPLQKYFLIHAKTKSINEQISKIIVADLTIDQIRNTINSYTNQRPHLP